MDVEVPCHGLGADDVSTSWQRVDVMDIHVKRAQPVPTMWIYVLRE
jgi:hypothetical protein